MPDQTHTPGAKAAWPDAPVIYHIYPRSFCDSNGDGIGDLAGVTMRLDHVADLGVDAIWLSSHYVSPWADGGYDIVDHEAVDPRLGSLQDFDDLIARAHDLGLRVIIDQVLNHTSHDHPWFTAALGGDDDMAERYLFRDAKPDGSPPNNWLSQFGIPGWTWSHRRQQYYFHQFLGCQPSLDLRHPDVQAAHCDQIAFWRARGVDGFRFDAVSSYLWDERLRDNPPARPEVKAKVTGPEGSIYKWQDHVHDMLPGDGAKYAETLRDWAGPDAWLMGEITSGNQSVALAIEFTEAGRLNAAYTTDLAEADADPATLAHMISEGTLGRQVGWLSSHDQKRHIGDGPDRLAEACAKAMLMAFLPGPWMLYQGEEWGLPQPSLHKEEVTDPFDLLYWPDHPGREGARVPMPWTDQEPHFGFTDGAPWLPMRWQGLLQHRQTVQAHYRTLIAERRRFGWGAARVVTCAQGDDWLDLTISATGGAFRLWYATPDHAGAAPIPTGDAIWATDAKTGWRAAVWQTGAPAGPLSPGKKTPQSQQGREQTVAQKVAQPVQGETE
jgi:alpha-glucosidase